MTWNEKKALCRSECENANSDMICNGSTYQQVCATTCDNNPLFTGRLDASRCTPRADLVSACMVRYNNDKTGKICISGKTPSDWSSECQRDYNFNFITATNGICYTDGVATCKSNCISAHNSGGQWCTDAQNSSGVATYCQSQCSLPIQNTGFTYTLNVSGLCPVPDHEKERLCRVGCYDNRGTCAKNQGAFDTSIRTSCDATAQCKSGTNFTHNVNYTTICNGLPVDPNLITTCINNCNTNNSDTLCKDGVTTIYTNKNVMQIINLIPN